MLIGAVTPADLSDPNAEIPPALRLAMFSGFSRRTQTNTQDGDLEGESPASLFRKAAGPEAQAAVVVQSVSARLARALGVPADEIEPSKLLSDCGVDSLMAVELRNWIKKEFEASVAVFEFMGGLSIQGLGDLVAKGGNQ